MSLISLVASVRNQALRFSKVRISEMALVNFCQSFDCRDTLKVVFCCYEPALGCLALVSLELTAVELHIMLLQMHQSYPIR